MSATPSQLRIGIIGAGYRGIRAFGAELKKVDDARVVALMDPNPVRLATQAATFPVPPATWTDRAAMLAAGGLDAVIITSPDHCHEADAVAVLQAGIPVLVDKPLATTVAGCRRIIDTAAKHGQLAMMGFNLRHRPVVAALKKLVDAGTLGRVFLIENREFYQDGRTYMARWNRRYELSGGLWIHKGSHDFDVFNWLLGFPKPLRVSATAGVNALSREYLPFTPEPGTDIGPTCRQCAYRERCPDVFDMGDLPEFSPEAAAADGYQRDRCMYLSDKDTHDNGIAIVEYENGARASHLECFVTSQTDRLYTVVGDKGQAEASVHENWIRVRPRWGEPYTIAVPEASGGHGGADPALVRSFLSALRGETRDAATLDQGLWATAIGQAAELASRQGRTVPISELF